MLNRSGIRLERAGTRKDEGGRVTTPDDFPTKALDNALQAAERSVLIPRADPSEKKKNGRIVHTRYKGKNLAVPLRGTRSAAPISRDLSPQKIAKTAKKI